MRVFTFSSDGECGRQRQKLRWRRLTAEDFILTAGGGFGGKLGEENQGQKQQNQPQREVNVKSVAKFGQVNHISSNMSSVLTANSADRIARNKDSVNTAESRYDSGRNKKAVAELARIDDRILNWLGRMIKRKLIDVSLEEALMIVNSPKELGSLGLTSSPRPAG